METPQLKAGPNGMPATVVTKVVEHSPTASIGTQQFLARGRQKPAQRSDLLRDERLSRAGNILFVHSGAKFIDAGGSQNPVPRQRPGAGLCGILGAVNRRNTRDDRVGAEDGVSREQAVLRGRVEIKPGNPGIFPIRFDIAAAVESAIGIGASLGRKRYQG